VIGGRQRGDVAEELDDEQMEMVEAQINAWVEDYEGSRRQ